MFDFHHITPSVPIIKEYIHINNKLLIIVLPVQSSNLLKPMSTYRYLYITIYSYRTYISYSLRDCVSMILNIPGRILVHPDMHTESDPNKAVLPHNRCSWKYIFRPSESSNTVAASFLFNYINLRVIKRI